MKIGFVGLGNLGTAIAENILHKRQQLLVYNRTAAKAQPLIAKGAVLCNTVKELASTCDILFSMVSDDAALNHITKGIDGIAQNLRPGGVHICMSTILPATASQLSAIHDQYNSHYIAAPVMGRPEAARAGKLHFLVSGKKEIIDGIKPLLEDAGATGIWEFGNDAAAANIAKLCNNSLIISAIESMAEAINLAKKSGIDPHTWINMITQSVFAAPVYINYGNILVKEIYQPAGFTLRLGLKDAKLVMEQSREVNAEMPIGQLMQKRFNDGVANGLGDHDWTAVALLLGR